MTSEKEDVSPLKRWMRARTKDDLGWAMVLREINDGLYLRGWFDEIKRLHWLTCNDDDNGSDDKRGNKQGYINNSSKEAY